MQMERLRTRVKHNSLWASVLAFSCVGLIFAKETEGTRNILPEPFDFFDHAGNVNGSAQIGYGVGLLTGIIAARRANNQDNPERHDHIRAKMAAAGAAVGLLINGISETKFGLSLVGDTSTTPDLIDYAYGVIAAGTCAMLPTVQTETIPEYRRYSYPDGTY